MARQVGLADLAQVARDLIARPGRQVMAIAGAPGAGKSTLVERLLAALPDGSAAILPMDGFHFDDGVLNAMGRRPWKGAPDTFDVGGLRATLKRLRDPAEGSVAVPVFDRDLEISRGSARIIDPQVRLILTEGNYLLLNQPPWTGLHPLFDATVMIEVPEAELKRRLRARWTGYDLTPGQIDFKLEQNDLPNGRQVAGGSVAADYILRTG